LVSRPIELVGDAVVVNGAPLDKIARAAIMARVFRILIIVFGDDKKGLKEGRIQMIGQQSKDAIVANCETK
jgi:hypothetical protein